MRKTTAFFLLSLFLVLSSAPIVLAQEEVPRITYDQVYTYKPTEPNHQFFAQFEGSIGDIVYLLADYEGIVIADLEIDLRDSVGRTVGLRDEYSFQKFILAELPSNGLYTVVITAEEPEPVEYIVGTTALLNDGFTTTIKKEGFPVLAGLHVPRSGYYTLTCNRISGDLGTSFDIITFSEFFNENVITVRGTEVGSWSARVFLKQGNQYVAFIDRNIFSGGGDEAILQMQLQPPTE